MLMRQQFVVQLRITEVQWNQRLPVLCAILSVGCRTNPRQFCRKKAFRRGHPWETAAPTKQMRITGASRR